MKNIIKKTWKKVRKPIIYGLAGLVISCSPLLRKNVDHYEVKGWKIGDISIKISYDDNECWRVIKVSTPDRIYVEARDEITDCDKKFNNLTTNLSYETDKDIGHPLMEYKSFKVLEELYKEIKENAIQNG